MQDGGGTRHLLYNNVLTKLARPGLPLFDTARIYSFDGQRRLYALKGSTRDLRARTTASGIARKTTDGSLAQERILFPASF